MQYPECEKLKAVVQESQIIGEFLEGMGEKGYVLGKRDTEWPYGLTSINIPTEKLLAEYFGIDLNKVESEKRQMLDQMRELNQ